MDSVPCTQFYIQKKHLIFYTAAIKVFLKYLRSFASKLIAEDTCVVDADVSCYEHAERKVFPQEEIFWYFSWALE
jgi:hypothetical protein